MDNGGFVVFADALVDRADAFVERTDAFVDSDDAFVKRAEALVKSAGVIVKRAGVIVERAGAFVEISNRSADILVRVLQKKCSRTGMSAFRFAFVIKLNCYENNIVRFFFDIYDFRNDFRTDAVA